MKQNNLTTVQKVAETQVRTQFCSKFNAAKAAILKERSKVIQIQEKEPVSESTTQ